MSNKNFQRADAITRERRAELIANGLWMGRNVVHRSRRDYNRQREKLAVKHAVAAY